MEKLVLGFVGAATVGTLIVFGVIWAIVAMVDQSNRMSEFASQCQKSNGLITSVSNGFRTTAICTHPYKK